MQFQLFKEKCEKKIIVNSIKENLNDQILINNPITSQEILYLKNCKSNRLEPDKITFAYIYNFGGKIFDLLATILVTIQF